MIEFFFAFLMFQEPGGKIMFETKPYMTHAECSSAIQAVEQNLKAVAPEGTEIRVSCISSESIGQNSV